jgi:hypothetical protein
MRSADWPPLIDAINAPRASFESAAGNTLCRAMPALLYVMLWLPVVTCNVIELYVMCGPFYFI